MIISNLVFIVSLWILAADLWEIGSLTDPLPPTAHIGIAIIPGLIVLYKTRRFWRWAWSKYGSYNARTRHAPLRRCSENFVESAVVVGIMRNARDRRRASRNDNRVGAAAKASALRLRSGQGNRRAAWNAGANTGNSDG